MFSQRALAFLRRGAGRAVGLTGMLCIISVAHPARADVSDLGAYQTSVSIEAPAFHAIAPSIRLVYTSNGGNGPLGLGWSLQAGSRISRTSAATGVPHYDATDQLWLDGMELTPCAQALQSASCRTGGSHTPRVEGFNRITQDLATNTWTVWKRDGSRFVYGPQLGDTSTPAKTLRWALTDVIDTHGNRATYSYTCDGARECYLASITYGGGKRCKPQGDKPVGSQVPGVKVVFSWVRRGDPLTVAIGGAFEEIDWRLRTIDVTDGGKLARVYQLTYQDERPGAAANVQSGVSWLASVQQFGKDAIHTFGGRVTSGTALPATTFRAPAEVLAPARATAQTVAMGQDFLPIQPSTVVQQTLPVTYDHRVGPPGQIATGDFDGDGRLDVVGFSVDSNCALFSTSAELTSQPATATPPAAVTVAWTGSNNGFCEYKMHTADLDGDGRTDLLFETYAKLPNAILPRVDLVSALSRGDGTFALSTAFQTWNLHGGDQCVIADLNGDRRSDHICLVPVDLQGQFDHFIIDEAISTGGGHFLNSADNTALTFSATSMLSSADVNADGLADLIIVERGPLTNGVQQFNLRVGISRGDGTFQWRAPQTASAPVQPGGNCDDTRVFSGDFNNDGFADISVYYANCSHDLIVDSVTLRNASIITFLSTAGASNFFQITRQDLAMGIPGSISVGDGDGDGRDDLLIAVKHEAHNASSCGVAVNHDHPSLWLARSLGNGTFDLPPSLSGCYRETDWSWDGHWRWPLNVRAADVNGDGLADFFNFASSNGADVTDAPAPVPSQDQLPWHAVDISGDGRIDWVYTKYANPGVSVISLVTQPDGSRLKVRTDIASSGGSAADLSRPGPARYPIIADFGGGVAGAADGKGDIVFIDEERKQVVTLFSNGDGSWRKASASFALTFPRDTHNWRAMDIDRDGRADLVHTSLEVTSTGSQLVVDVLRSLGDGTWSEVSHQVHFAGQYDNPNVRAFKAMDVNGDGMSDLVAVEFLWTQPHGFNTRIWTLISRGDGTFDEHVQEVNQPLIDTAAWQPMDVNGDGRMDLVRLSSKPGPGLTVLSMLSRGDGTWEPVQYAVASGASGLDIASLSLANAEVADLDGDGKPDIVHLIGNIATGATPAGVSAVVIWNRFPAFVATTTSGLPFNAKDMRDWRAVDTDGDGYPEYVRVEPAALTTYLDVISIPVREARITRVANGMGGSEQIAYRTTAGLNADMPLGALQRMAASVAVRARTGPGSPASLTRFSYAGATYSRARRQFLGFTQTTAADSARSVVTSYELTDDCGARSTGDRLLDVQGLEIGDVVTTFAPRTVPGAATLCLPAGVERREAEGQVSPRISQDALSFDAFGNLTARIQTSDVSHPADVRKFESVFNPNTHEYIVDRVAKNDVSGMGQTLGTWRLLASTRYEYDNSGDYRAAPQTLGDLTRVRLWNDTTGGYADTTYVYETSGNVHAVTGPATPSNSAGVTVTATYDCDCDRYPLKICDPLFCETADWDTQLDAVRSRTDANGAVTLTDRDALGRVVLIRRPDQSFDRWIWPTLNQWNTSRQVITHQISDGSPTDGVLWSVDHFDGLGRTTLIQHEGGATEQILHYDGASTRPTHISAPRFPGEPAQVSVIDYDAAGRPVAMRHPDRSQRTLRHQVGLTTATDELGATHGFEIDPFGRVTAVLENERGCLTEACPIKATGRTTYAYDALYRLTGILDAIKNPTTIVWDSLDRQRSDCDPDRGCTSRRWNDDGAEASETNALGSTLAVVYDPVGRPSAATSMDAMGQRTRTIRWTWDRDPMTGSVSGDSLGRVTRQDDVSAAANLSASFRYDALGRADRFHTCVDSRCVDMAVGFDLAGRLLGVRYPDASGALSAASEVVDYRYSPAGDLQSIPGYARFVHDAAGRTSHVTFTNGVQELRPHDPARGWTDGVTVGRGAPIPVLALFGQSLRHDLAGRVRKESVKVPGSTRTDDFTHDDLGRLTDVASTDPGRNQHYDYDLLGDITSHPALGTISYGDPAHVHAATDTTSGERYKYDALGQLTASNQLSLSWSTENRPIEIRSSASSSVSRFAYDSHGRRVKTEVKTAPPGGTTATDLEPNPLVEISNGVSANWIMAEGRRLARHDASGKVFLHADSLGSTRLVTDAHGAVVDRDDYAVWGRNTHSGSSGVAIRFAGEKADAQTGLDDMNARFYHPGLSRFVSADTLIPDLYNPQSLNRYTYALNDPATLADPSGHQADEPGSAPPAPPPDPSAYWDSDLNTWGLDLTEQPSPDTGPTLSADPTPGGSVPNVPWVSYDQHVVDRDDILNWVRGEEESGSIPSSFSTLPTPIPFMPQGEDHRTKVTLTINYLIVHAREELGNNYQLGQVLIRARNDAQKLRDNSTPRSSESIILRDVEHYLWGRVGTQVYSKLNFPPFTQLAASKGAPMFSWMADPVYNYVKMRIRFDDSLMQYLFGKGILSVAPGKPMSAVGGTGWFWQGLDDYYENDATKWDTPAAPSLAYQY